MKVCSKCNVEQELDCFSKQLRNKSGVRPDCKSCEKKYREANKERRREYDLNRDKDEVSRNKSAYYLANKDVILKKRKEHYSLNREEKLEYQKEYQANNKEKRNQYLFERRETDPLFKLITNIRNLINNSFYDFGYSKNSRTQEILGCSFEEFKAYLESKFEPWMNWDNRGKYNGELDFGWDLDHEIPLSSAMSEQELIKLNHYKNLSPLCSKVNRDIKKNKINI